MANYSIVLDDYLEKDNTASGLLFRKEVRFNGSGVGCPLYVDSKGFLIQCNANKNELRMPCDFLAIQPGEGMKLVLGFGTIRNDRWSWKKGDRIYVSSVEGSITNKKPNNGHCEQEIGVALYPNIVLFRPKQHFINIDI